MPGVVAGRIAEVHADAVRTALLDDPTESGGDVAERFVPGAALELARSSDPTQREPHAIRVVVDGGEVGPLRAQVAAGRMVRIALNTGDPALFNGDNDAAVRLADAADARPLLGGSVDDATILPNAV